MGSVYFTKPEGVQDSVSAGSGKVLDNKMVKTPFNCAIFPLTQTQVEVVVLVYSSIILSIGAVITTIGSMKIFELGIK